MAGFRFSASALEESYYMCFASQKKRGGVFDLSWYEFPSPISIALALGKASSGFEQHLSESTLCKSASVYQATTKVLLRRKNKSQTADNGTNWMVVLSEWQNNDVMENNLSEQGREPQNSSYIGSRTWHRTRDTLVECSQTAILKIARWKRVKYSYLFSRHTNSKSSEWRLPLSHTATN